MNVTAGRFPACLHAVDKHSCPRLGLVYEVQAIGGNAIDKPHTLITEEEPTCMCTASASVKGLDGLQILRVFTLPCNCREAGHGHAEPAGDGRGSKMGGRGEGTDGASAACTSTMLEVELIDGSGVDADEASPTTRPTSWESLPRGDVKKGCGDNHVLRIARPVCSDACCTRCRWCRRDVVMGQTPRSGVESSLCSRDLEDFAQKIIANLEWSHKEALVLKSDFGVGDS